jgi:hypothetical protein
LAWQSIFEGSLLGKILGFTTRIINPETLLNTVTGREKLFTDSPFDERTRLILSKAQVPTGIFINKNLAQIEHLFMPILDATDVFLIQYAQKLIYNAGAQIILMDMDGQIRNNADIKERIRAIEQNAPNHIAIRKETELDRTFLHEQDMMLISLNSWKKLVNHKTAWLSDIPSTLIVVDKMG